MTRITQKHISLARDNCPSFKPSNIPLNLTIPEGGFSPKEVANLDLPIETRLRILRNAESRHYVTLRRHACWCVRQALEKVPSANPILQETCYAAENEFRPDALDLAFVKAQREAAVCEMLFRVAAENFRVRQAELEKPLKVAAPDSSKQVSRAEAIWGRSVDLRVKNKADEALAEAISDAWLKAQVSEAVSYLVKPNSVLFLSTAAEMAAQAEDLVSLKGLYLGNLKMLKSENPEEKKAAEETLRDASNRKEKAFEETLEAQLKDIVDRLSL